MENTEYLNQAEQLTPIIQQPDNISEVVFKKSQGFKLIYVFGPILLCTLGWAIL